MICMTIAEIWLRLPLAVVDPSVLAVALRRRTAVEQAAPRQERQDAIAGRERRCRCRLGPKPLLPAGEDSGHLRSYQVDVSALMDDVPRRAEFR
jgi:hypothetical protein